MEQFSKNGYLISIDYDENVENPREWDYNLTKMYCRHNKYILGDGELGLELHNSECSNWNDELRMLQRKFNIAVIQPLFLFDHGGLSISTSKSCTWDSGQVGFIFITKEELRDIFDIKRVTSKHLARAEEMLYDELKTYDNYLRGEVYCYSIEDEITGETVDSCGGWYGYESLKDIKDEIKTFLSSQPVAAQYLQPSLL